MTEQYNENFKVAEEYCKLDSLTPNKKLVNEPASTSKVLEIDVTDKTTITKKSILSNVENVGAVAIDSNTTNVEH